MAKDPGKTLIKRLEKTVAMYQHPPFRLANDLACAVRIRSLDAPEAIIMYCARILEAMAPRVLAALELPYGDNVFSNLLVFERYQLMPSDELTWAHALRLLGNNVRHMTSDLKHTDAELALFFTQCWLEWFFCDYPSKEKKLQALTRDGKPLRLCTCADLKPVIKIVRELETNRKSTPDKAVALCERTSHMTPVIPALLAKAMIGRKQFTKARKILTSALKIHPDDLRLQQLVGLSFSRQGKLDEAVKWLEPLYVNHRDDDETDGILAGVYKRLWQKTLDRGRLERAHSVYRQGWERGKKVNSYLGINAATTALWLDRLPLARRLAADVESLLSKGAEALRKHGLDAQAKCDYWTQVTWPEAMLILGRLAEARQLYRAAFAGHGALVDEINVARNQAVAILQKLGLTAANKSWFKNNRKPAGDNALRVAVTGPRTLTPGVDYGQQIRDVLQQLRGSGIAGHGPELVVRCALAEGADQLFAETALGKPVRGHLEIVLPLEVAEYNRDFKTAQSLQQFQRLLALADVIHFPPDPEQQPDAEFQRKEHAEQDQAPKNRNAALRRAPPAPVAPPASAPEAPAIGEGRDAATQSSGRTVVDGAHALLVIWDGQPSHGVDNTGEIVACARKLGLPLAWIHTNPQRKVTLERISDK